MESLSWIRTAVVLQLVLMSSRAHYMNQWSVELDDHEELNVVAKETGCESKGKLGRINYRWGTSFIFPRFSSLTILLINSLFFRSHR